jgi:hypothetical protein
MTDQHDPDEIADLIGEITRAYGQHAAAEASRHPLTYDIASHGDIVTQMGRYRELAEQASMATAIAVLKARGDYEPSEHVNEDKFPPLTVADHLELLALGERIARYYRHPSYVDSAARAGATWDQIAAATGTTAEAARAAYIEWAEGQHELHAETGVGLDDDEYAAALELADQEGAQDPDRE